ncbi:MAG: hypothetical protein R3C44_22345 [Chloroflexota bacterium]
MGTFISSGFLQVNDFCIAADRQQRTDTVTWGNSRYAFAHRIHIANHG